MKNRQRRFPLSYQRFATIVKMFCHGFRININTPFWDDSDHIQDRSRLRSPKQVAETIINEYKRQAEIIVE
ncbi:hypothetical protein [Anoxybacillus flavithermus]|uniref:hypothetical protein n=1 Tax=Anoxybacillus flavithermus TaxID=33934 RepID=UPI001F511CD6|nr:hypothetical protein [Anoxybacillus flavithermus]